MLSLPARSLSRGPRAIGLSFGVGLSRISEFGSDDGTVLSAKIGGGGGGIKGGRETATGWLPATTGGGGSGPSGSGIATGCDGRRRGPAPPPEGIMVKRVPELPESVPRRCAQGRPHGPHGPYD